MTLGRTGGGGWNVKCFRVRVWGPDLAEASIMTLGRTGSGAWNSRCFRVKVRVRVWGPDLADASIMTLGRTGGGSWNVRCFRVRVWGPDLAEASIMTLGRTGGGGTGSTVSTIQSGRAKRTSKPSAAQSSSLMRFRISCAFSAVPPAAAPPPRPSRCPPRPDQAHGPPLSGVRGRGAPRSSTMEKQIVPMWLPCWAPEYAAAMTKVTIQNAATHLWIMR